MCLIKGIGETPETQAQRLAAEEAVRVEAARQEEARLEVARQEAVRQEEVRLEAARQEEATNAKVEQHAAVKSPSLVPETGTKVEVNTSADLHQLDLHFVMRVNIETQEVIESAFYIASTSGENNETTTGLTGLDSTDCSSDIS
jgi:hypothetical protein